MKWSALAIASYLALALQVGAASLLALHTQFGRVEPRFTLILLVLVALYASPRIMAFTSLGLGALVDLISVHPGGLVFIGPHAFAYLAAGYVVLQWRNMLLRQHPLSLAFVILIAGISVNLVVIGVFELRYWVHTAVDWAFAAGWFNPLKGWSATEQLVAGVLSAAYTAALALLPAPLLLRMAPSIVPSATPARSSRPGRR